MTRSGRINLFFSPLEMLDTNGDTLVYDPGLLYPGTPDLETPAPDDALFVDGKVPVSNLVRLLRQVQNLQTGGRYRQIPEQILIYPDT